LEGGLFDYSLAGLFLASFLAATIVPFSSEALLSFLIVNGTDPVTAVLVATAGNWLGGMSSFGIGYLGKWEWIEKYLRIKRESIEKWHNRLYRRGAVFAFLSWVPAVGDIFAVGLGLLRSNIVITALAMLAGKFLRYVVWGWLTGLAF
jgi:membrane protein YqaA with SNARE-associated domain